MSEVHSGGGLKVFVLVVFAAGAGLVASGGFLFLGWKLAGSPRVEEPTVDGEVLKEVVLVDRENGGQESVTKKQKTVTEEWMESISHRSAVQSGLKKGREVKVAKKKVYPKRPIVAKAPIETNESIYQQHIDRKDVLVLVEYHAASSGACRQMRQTMFGLAKLQGDKVLVLRIDIDKEKGLSEMAGVDKLPDRRLYYAGQELDREIGGTNSAKLADFVLRHEPKLPVPEQEERAPQVAKKTVPQKTVLRKPERRQPSTRNGDQSGVPTGITPMTRKLERPKPQVGADNRLLWPEGKQASVPKSKEKPTVDPQTELKSGTIEPMEKDWLPPGVTRVK